VNPSCNKAKDGRELGMETTIAQLLRNAIQADFNLENGSQERRLWQLNKEAATLANNAIEERLQELIEAKVNQMLKRV